MRIINKKKTKNKKLINIIILTIIILTIILSFILINNSSNKTKENENITTKLNYDTDFLIWFTEFDTLYKEKITDINYSLTTNMIEKINTFLTKENNNNIYYKNNIYYIDEYNTIELDTHTRSLRHIVYNKEQEKIEILEINLKNGKYYIQLITPNDIYKIILNNNKVKKKYKKNKGNVEVSNSIFNTLDFKW